MGLVLDSTHPYPPTHASLLSRLRDRTDHRAWQEFESRYRDLLLRFCCRRGLQPADAEDVVQDVFTSLSQSLSGFSYDPAVGRFHCYLFRCIRNGISHWARRGDRGCQRLESDVAAAVADSDAGSHEREIWEAEWAAHHYRRALERVRAVLDAQTVAILERSLEGAGVTQLASELSMSVDAVYKARQRSRERLQDLVAEQIREEDGSFA